MKTSRRHGMAGAALACAVWAGATMAAESAWTQQSKPQLRYGLTASVIEGANPSDVRAASLVWTQGVADIVGLFSGTEATVFDTPTAALRAVNEGTLDVLALSSLEYLSIENRLSASPALTWEYSSVLVDFVLVSRVGTGGLENASGKTLALYAPNRPWALSDAWANVLLADSGLPGGRKALSSVSAFDKKGRGAMAVFFRQADYAIEERAAFETAVELNPQLGRELRVLARSPELLPGLVCITTRFDRELRSRYVDAATHLHETTRYEQTFLTMRVTRLVEWRASYLDAVRALARDRPTFLPGHDDN